MKTKRKKNVLSGNVGRDAQFTRCYMSYLGVLSLLGRIARLVPDGDPDRYGLDRAFADANHFFEMNGSGLRYEETSAGGYAAFEREEPKRGAPTT